MLAGQCLTEGSTARKVRSLISDLREQTIPKSRAGSQKLISFPVFGIWGLSLTIDLLSRTYPLVSNSASFLPFVVPVFPKVASLSNPIGLSALYVGTRRAAPFWNTPHGSGWGAQRTLRAPKSRLPHLFSKSSYLEAHLVRLKSCVNLSFGYSTYGLDGWARGWVRRQDISTDTPTLLHPISIPVSGFFVSESGGGNHWGGRKVEF